MKYLLSAAAASTLMAGTAFAGNIQPAPMEPVIAPAPMAVNTSPNWTGFYAGGELGYANVDLSDPSGSMDESGLIGGLVAGYDYDLGDWVIGAGFDYDWTDVSFNLGGGTNLDIDSVWRAKLRGGYKLGNGLLYATAGYAQAEASTTGFGSADDDGYFVGAGYEHLVTQNMSLGGEVLYHEFDNFDSSGIDAEIVTAQVRATFRF
ncbi:outer membrane protein [Roseovarius dicentrarchi]|uniref:outer membrane protein n=1 Tax=Roseovarius dicentrarchi TaxID=2250573 RepID=UPI000DEB4812|nr:outer membrane beta-barrel protein [Roseovarius dicentrarchi]